MTNLSQGKHLLKGETHSLGHFVLRKVHGGEGLGLRRPGLEDVDESSGVGGFGLGVVDFRDESVHDGGNDQALASGFVNLGEDNGPR